MMIESANRTIRVVIGDRRRLIAEALAAMIEGLKGFTVTAVVSTEEAIPAIVCQKPDMALVGVGEDSDGTVELVRIINARAPDVDIVLLAETADPELVRFVLDNSLAGLLLTDASSSDMAASLGQVAHGHSILPRGWRCALSSNRDDPLDLLSARQLEVLTLLEAGCSYEEIGSRLFISPNTVKFHVRSIFLRLGVRNRMEAVRLLSERRNRSTRGVRGQTGERGTVNSAIV
jgi:DNA-binding NarL/FixJ family response regulator